MTDAEPGSREADSWRPSNRLAIEAVTDSVYASFGSAQGDARWEEARRAAESAGDVERQFHCELLRDLFGEFLGPPGDEGAWLPCGLASETGASTEPEQWCLLPTPREIDLRAEWLAWNDGTIPRLAQVIYQEQAFDRLGILADALEDAGCTDPVILGHLRGPGPHAQGCFVLDLLLGKVLSGPPSPTLGEGVRG
jgi:hypothetical protein